MKQIMHQIKKHEKQILTYAVLILALILLVVFFNKTVILIVTVCMFIFLNVVIKFYKRIFPGLPIELEFTIFGSVLCTIAFGLWAGLIVAFMSSFFAEFLNQRISPHSFVNIVVYLLVPFMSLLVKESYVVTGGIAVTIITNIMLFIVFQFYWHQDILRNSAYNISNVIWNYLLFSYLASAVLTVLI